MSKKEKGRKWDGKSRISTDLYRKRWNEIFRNKILGNDAKMTYNMDTSKKRHANKKAKNEETRRQT